jgi:hypothetical protein
VEEYQTCRREKRSFFFISKELRETLNDPSGLKLFDPDFCEKCLKFCDAIEKKLGQPRR